MKVRVLLSIDVDPDRWATEYGIDKREVRADVTRYVEYLVQGQLGRDGLDLLADQSVRSLVGT